RERATPAHDCRTCPTTPWARSSDVMRSPPGAPRGMLSAIARSGAVPPVSSRFSSHQHNSRDRRLVSATGGTSAAAAAGYDFQVRGSTMNIEIHRADPQLRRMTLVVLASAMLAAIL